RSERVGEGGLSFWLAFLFRRGRHEIGASVDPVAQALSPHRHSEPCFPAKGEDLDTFYGPVRRPLHPAALLAEEAGRVCLGALQPAFFRKGPGAIGQGARPYDYLVERDGLASQR